jgi:lipopolysaccharide/colanic/teichoic acid biosynthesis glycosyltransferase
MCAAIGLALTSWLIVGFWLFMSVDTRSNGMFSQLRVGKDGRLFKVYKIRTMRANGTLLTTVTVENDLRITKLGRILRRLKLDELPQLFNVLKGDMSFVGPRPDVPGYADSLSDEDRLILTVRPGITGPATLKYRDEERILASVPDPERYNEKIIFPDKVIINKNYVVNYSFRKDIEYILRTIFH